MKLEKLRNSFNVQPNLIATAFEETIQEKFDFAKSMLKSRKTFRFCVRKR